MQLRRAAQLPPRGRPLLGVSLRRWACLCPAVGVSLRRWARLCPAVDRMVRLSVRATAGRPSRRTPEANEPHTPCRCGGRASPTLVPHPFHILLSARMLPCIRPNHMHMIASVDAHIHHTITHAPARVSMATLTPMAAGSPAQTAGFGSHRAVICGSAAIRSGAHGRRWRRSRRGGRAAAPGLVLEASEAQELADSGLLVLLQDQSRQR